MAVARTSLRISKAQNMLLNPLNLKVCSLELYLSLCEMVIEDPISWIHVMVGKNMTILKNWKDFVREIPNMDII